jgi:hypothetical protein
MGLSSLRQLYFNVARSVTSRLAEDHELPPVSKATDAARQARNGD